MQNALLPAGFSACAASQDVRNVVSSAAGTDIAGEDALVLVASGGGDLGGVVAVAGGLCGIPGSKRVAGELAWVEASGAGRSDLNLI